MLRLSSRLLQVCGEPLLGAMKVQRASCAALAASPMRSAGSLRRTEPGSSGAWPSGSRQFSHGWPPPAHPGPPPRQRPDPLEALPARRLRRPHAAAGVPALPPPQPRTRLMSMAPWWQFWRLNSHAEEGDGTGPKLRPPAPLPERQPSAVLAREMRAINTAIVVNMGIFVAKLAAWAVTSSGALLAEAMHSLADTMNQALLRAGVQQSRRKPTEQHPYGFHREKYIYSLISAVGIFCLGAGASVVHGIQSLMDPHPLEHLGWSAIVLVGSAAAEMYSLRIALQALRLGAREQGQGFWQFIRRGRDPTTTAVLAEDAGAVAGLGIAGFTTYMAYATGNPVYDAFGSIAVGALMGGIAVTLIRNNKRFLIGQSMSSHDQSRIVRHLESDPMVLKVCDPKSEELGDGVFRFKAEIQWSGQHVVEKCLRELGRDSMYSQIRQSACRIDVDQDVLQDAMDMAMIQFGQHVIRTVGEEIDRLEEELKQMVPGLIYVDLETDKGKAEREAVGTLGFGAAAPTGAPPGSSGGPSGSTAP